MMSGKERGKWLKGLHTVFKMGKTWAQLISARKTEAERRGREERLNGEESEKINERGQDMPRAASRRGGERVQRKHSNGAAERERR